MRSIGLPEKKARGPDASLNRFDHVESRILDDTPGSSARTARRMGSRSVRSATPLPAPIGTRSERRRTARANRARWTGSSAAGP